jgi:hypothetical protein
MRGEETGAERIISETMRIAEANANQGQRGIPD